MPRSPFITLTIIVLYMLWYYEWYHTRRQWMQILPFVSGYFNKGKGFQFRFTEHPNCSNVLIISWNGDIPTSQGSNSLRCRTTISDPSFFFSLSLFPSPSCDPPLLVNGHKFHLRLYALACGCLSVYTFNQVCFHSTWPRMPDGWKHLHDRPLFSRNGCRMCASCLWFVVGWRLLCHYYICTTLIKETDVCVPPPWH